MAAPHPALLHVVRGEAFPPGFRVTMPIVDSAVEHGVAPLLDEAVRSDDLDGDHDALVQLAMRSLESAADTNAAVASLGTFVDAADSLGIEVAVFKGLAIGTRWYPRPELRPAGDIDVVVAPEQRSRIGELIGIFDRELGNLVNESVDLSQGFDHGVAVDDVPVDVHTDPVKLLLPPRRPDLAWQHTARMRLVDGRTVRVFDLELSIIHTLINLLRDNVGDLLHVYDISVMLDQDPDWVVITDFAASEGWTDVIRFSLGAACEVLDRPSPLPTDLTATNRALAAAIWPRRILLAGSDSAATSLRRQALVSLLISGRRREILTPILQRTFPARRLIDHQSPDPGGPYLRALYRWRKAQRDTMNRIASSPSAEGQREPGAASPGTPERGANRETV